MNFGKIYKYGAFLSVAILPAIVTVCLIQYLFGAGIDTFRPMASDEIDYWHEILTFSKYGFGGGYYTIEEGAARASFSHFGPHGPFFPMIYGTLAKITGWQVFSSPYFNLSAIGAAIIVFGCIVKPSTRQLLGVLALLLTFWPILLYIPSVMQESLHHALAIVLAALFYRLLSKEAGMAIRVSLVLLIIAASLLRPTWSMLFIPFFLASGQTSPATRAIKPLVYSALSIVTFFLLAMYLSAPYPDGFLNLLLSKMKSGWLEGALLLSKHAFDNAALLFNGFFVPEVILRVQVILLTGLSVYACLFKRKSASSIPETSALFNIANLGAVFVLVVVLYDVGNWRDFRVLAPHLLLSLLLLALQGKALIGGIIVLSSVFIAPQFIQTYNLFHKKHFVHNAWMHQRFISATKPFISYKPNDDAWSNTLIADEYMYKSVLVGVPPGIGIGLILNKDRLRFPLKSRYLILSSKTYEAIKQQARLVLVSDVPFGGLYLNLDQAHVINK